jgi:twitching motility protein PilT
MDSVVSLGSSMNLDDFLTECVEQGASDLHLSVQSPPLLRLQGALKPSGGSALGAEDMALLIDEALTDEQKQVFERERSLDFGHSIATGQRFRINAYYERGNPAMAIRWLDSRYKTLDELGLPEKIASLARLQHGLVLVTGPTGSGKTTTLSAMIHQINEERQCHILTIEDPVEYLHENRQSLVHQRELHTDVPDFARAVRSAMREDPDVILVGEMRDLETMRASMMAAETGHLVLSTLHTGDAVGVLERMVGAFPGDEQDSIRQQLSMVLRAVVAQHLVPAKTPGLRLPAVEILSVNSAVSHLIRSGKSQQLVSAMESGRKEGMQTIEFALSELVLRGEVDLGIAERFARDESLLHEMVRRGLPGADAERAE